MSGKVFLILMALSFLALAGTVTFQALEMNDYCLFETMFKK